MEQKQAIIIGAGPAGLTAAYELLDKTDIKPIIFEASDDVGGISKTVNHQGNYIDIGGHRFFSKSDRVIRWWTNIFPLQGAPSKDDLILHRKIPLAKECFQKDLSQKNPVKKDSPDPQKTEKLMLFRRRFSRIYFLKKLFSYPIAFNLSTFTNLGCIRLFKIITSYLVSKVFGPKPEQTLEDLFINRFGKQLYKIFFKDFTEKVWGVSCDKIKPDWGAQRIRGLSVAKAIGHAFRSLIKRKSELSQKKIETTLIKHFMYPKLGPGQLWQEVAGQIQSHGGEIHLNKQVVDLGYDGQKITHVKVKDLTTQEIFLIEGDIIFSTMPVKELVAAIEGEVPENVKEVARGLIYRDFMTVGLLTERLNISNDTKIKSINNILPDNWIYIQEPDVKLCRIQIFNNWSPYMVRDLNKVWLGLEYICSEGDPIWNLTDEAFAQFAIEELTQIGFVDHQAVVDHVVLRMKKTYPAYFGTYDRFKEVRDFTDKIENLFLVGRNGMHRYNNMDHSMLSAMVAVENIVNNVKTKDNIWEVNTEQEFHEARKSK